MKRRALLVVKKARTTVTHLDAQDQIVALVGFLTFFFGFAAGAILNLYFLAINHPLVHQFRGALTYKSAIIGDGMLLPILNMVAAAFILKNWEIVSRKIWQLAIVLGMAITTYFHVEQARNGVVNWAMPTPWHWNLLGLWHGIYMFSVASLLGLFFLISVKVVKEEKEISKEMVVVVLGILVFFVLLRLDYMTVSIF